MGNKEMRELAQIIWPSILFPDIVKHIKCPPDVETVRVPIATGEEVTFKMNQYVVPGGLLTADYSSKYDILVTREFVPLEEEDVTASP